MICATCGFGYDPEGRPCDRCSRQAALIESRRADMRAHLDAGLTPRSPHLPGAAPHWLPTIVALRAWRDWYEPCAVEFCQCMGRGHMTYLGLASSARTGPDACGGGRCGCEVCEKGRQAAVKGAPFDERLFDGSAPNGDKLGA